MTNSAIYLHYQGDRKPSDFADVTSIIDFITLPAADQAAFLELDILNAEDGGIIDPFSLVGDIGEFWADTQFFMLEFEGDLYFIDTQGYNYCRYVAKVINFPSDNQ